jgi:hypothetical protein
MAARLQRLFVFFTAGVALWLSFGILSLSGAEPEPSRIGLLPPLWLLPAIALAAAGLAWRLPVSTVPLVPLLFSAVIILPWLPLPMPSASLLWTGPLVYFVWFVIAVSCLLAREWTTFRPLTQWLGSPRSGPLVAAAVAFLLYAGAGARLSAIVPSGDEPHYLIIAQSLLRDRDLRVENNYAGGDYRSYHPNDLSPHYLHRGVDREIYSIHAPGLPVVIAPAFAVAGYPGVRLFMALMAAIACAIAWQVARLVTGSAGAAWFGWAATAFSVPVFFHSFTVYPDGFAMLPVMIGVLVLVMLDSSGAVENGSNRPPGIPQLVLCGASLAMLPWLHTRLSVVAGALGLAVVLRLVARPRPVRSVLYFLAIPAVSAAGWLGFFQVVYGTFNPSAPYGGYTQTYLSNIPRGLTGLLLDQQFGLLPNAPVMAVGLLGCFVLIRRRPRLGGELLLVVTLYVSAAAAYAMWWGGWSAPARFAVPVLPILVIACAELWSRANSHATRAFVAALLAVSLTITAFITLMEGGRLLYDVRDGVALWLERVSPVVSLPLALPSVFRGGIDQAWAIALVWIASATVAWAVLRLVERLRPLRSAVAATFTLFALALGVMAAATLSWSFQQAAPFSPASSQLTLLGASDSRFVTTGIDVRRFRSMTPDVAVQRVSMAPGPHRRGRDEELLRLTSLPAGRYRVVVESDSPHVGTLAFRIGRTEVPIDVWTMDGGSTIREIELPIEVHSPVISGDEQARGAAPRVRVEPLVVFSRGSRHEGYARRAARYEGGVVFFTDEEAYSEPTGFWVTGGRTTSVIVQSDTAAAEARFFVRNGMTPNRIGFQHGRWRQQIALGPGEERWYSVPIAPGKRAAVLRLSAEDGFTPSESEPDSSDRRFLGCWMELRK